METFLRLGAQDRRRRGNRACMQHVGSEAKLVIKDLHAMPNDPSRIYSKYITRELRYRYITVRRIMLDLPVNKIIALEESFELEQ